MIFYGAVVTPKTLTSYDALPHALLCVSRSTGNIDWIESDVPASSLQDVLAKHGFVDLADVELVELKQGEFLLPGFIDTHTVRTQFRLSAFESVNADSCNNAVQHAPQVPNLGRCA